MNVIQHDTEELRKMEVERQAMWDRLKKALNISVNDPAHKTVCDIQQSISPDAEIDVEALRNQLADSNK